jgi:Zn-dependent peptidase ImmA (M78 family)
VRQVIYTHWYLREQATKLLDELEIDGPPIDVELIIEKLGIELVEMTLPTWFFGSLLNIQGNFYIVVNRLMPETRKRFTIAHEIAHYVLHEEQLCYMKNSKRDYFHREADVFAAELCMPSKMIKKEARSWFNDYKFLAQLFGVSEVAMVRKMQELELLKGSDYTWVFAKK